MAGESPPAGPPRAGADPGGGAEAPGLLHGARVREAGAYGRQLLEGLRRRGDDPGGSEGGGEGGPGPSGKELVVEELHGLGREVEIVQKLVEETEEQAAEDGGHELQLRLQQERLKGLREKQQSLRALLQDPDGSPDHSNGRREAPFGPAAGGPGLAHHETERDRLIRTGAITPFHNLEGFDCQVTQGARKRGRSGDEAGPAGGTSRRGAAGGGGGDVASFAEFRPAGSDAQASAVGSIAGRPAAHHAGDEAHPDHEKYHEVAFDRGFVLPGYIWERLFDYQRTGVKWMWEIHTQQAGGIIGDEMGLGKTVQVVAFLAGLHASGKFRPSLVVMPATLLHQWLREIRTWYPLFRVAILHDGLNAGKATPAELQTRKGVVDYITSSDNGILLTTYEQLRINQQLLLAKAWGYVVLDEGHRIRNPEIEVSLVCKRVRCVHRIIMTGAPIQNKLSEIWSLFDFVYPGKLGTLPVFQTEFAVPIQIGGYSKATKLQVLTAFKCATALKELINPYLLRRRKADVNLQLPKKTEHVLFCTLLEEQVEAYRAYLESQEVGNILAGEFEVLAGITKLKKICNHLDLLRRELDTLANYGDPARSGKLQVALKVLSTWVEQGHKTLIFCQTQQMLDVMETAVRERFAGHPYFRMDGSTPMAKRNQLIDAFNADADVKFFVLTTRVGGLGVNLTGANRVLIYDPDWNPATDIQARERAWRIGQKRDVVIYRLVTSGTIEEKIYQRQVYKQYITNKILHDPKMKRFFHSRDIHDLFTLGDEYTVKGLDPASLLKDKNFAALAEPEKAPATAAGAPERPGSSERAAGAQDGGQDEAKLLRDLLDGDNLASALDHEKVIEAGSSHTRDEVNFEAARIARQAAEALKRSRQQCVRSPVDLPTWTGRAGASGAPRFGQRLNARMQGSLGRQRGDGGPVAGLGGGAALSSKDLISQIARRHRAQQQGGAARPEQAGTPSGEAARGMALMGQVVAFLNAHGGRAPSSVLVGHFREKVDEAELVAFKAVLKEVAQLKRRGDLQQWELKPSFSASSP